MRTVKSTVSYRTDWFPFPFHFWYILIPERRDERENEEKEKEVCFTYKLILKNLELPVCIVFENWCNQNLSVNIFSAKMEHEWWWQDGVSRSMIYSRSGVMLFKLVIWKLLYISISWGYFKIASESLFSCSLFLWKLFLILFIVDHRD